MQLVVDLLLEVKENKEEIKMQEGLKFTIKTKVKYNNRFAHHFYIF